MKYPKLRELKTSRQMVDIFKGYNHNLRIGDGEFFDMKNMTSDHFPVLSPRKPRGVYASPAKPNGLITKDALCYVDGTDFVINEYRIPMKLNDKPKQLISMGAYVIIMPDKKWVNTKCWTKDDEFDTENGCGDIEAFYPGVEGQSVTATYEMCKVDGTVYTGTTKSATAPENPTNAQLWIDISSTPHVLKQYSENSAVWTPIPTTYVKISATNIAQAFNQYDAVKISGFPDKEDMPDMDAILSSQFAEMDGAVYPLWEAYHDPGDDDRKEGTNDYIVIVGILDETVKCDTDLRLERTMPNMDFIVESGNRLYGCRYGVAANGEVVNEIYASKLGDFKNWNCFMQISTDSWVGGVGSDGQFTGAISHKGYPLFFKENCVHKVYGNYPANFQIQTTECRGVQKGCHNSLAIVNETLFYKSRSGVCAYDGSLPAEVSYVLGNEAYGEAVGGSHGNKYYISMKDANDVSNLFVYDMAKDLWHKEDDIPIECFCSCDGEMYAISNGKIITLLGSGTPDATLVEWMAETGEIGISSPDMKYLSRLTVRMSMEIGAEVSIYAKYDFRDSWESLCYLRNTDSLRSFSLPIRPKRCDHLKLRIEGTGAVKIYSITKTIEQGSEL